MLAYDCRGTPRDSFEARVFLAPLAALAQSPLEHRLPWPAKAATPKQRSCCKAFRSPAPRRSEIAFHRLKAALPPA